MKSKFLFITLFLIPCLCSHAFAKKIKVVFRYDDFILGNNIFQDSLIDLFLSKSIPLTIAVIPFSHSDTHEQFSSIKNNRLEILKSSVRDGVIEVSLHGYDHTNYTKKKIGGNETFKNYEANSEFAFVDSVVQYYKIKKGKDYLDSIMRTNITTFIPPYNSYDNTTLNILIRYGFNLISADIYGPYKNDKIKYLPCTIDNLENLKETISKNWNKDVIMVIMFHRYSFVGNPVYDHSPQISFKDLSSTLDWLNNYKIQCNSFSQLASTGEDLSRQRYDLNSKHLNGIISKRIKPDKVYLTSGYTFLRIIDFLFLMLYSSSIFVLAFKVVNYMFINKHHFYLTTALVLMTIILATLLFNDRFTEKYMLLTLTLGLSISVLVFVRIRYLRSLFNRFF